MKGRKRRQMAPRVDKLARLKQSVNAACDAFFRRRGMGSAKWNW
jgi:hypothetical protein